MINEAAESCQKRIISYGITALIFNRANTPFDLPIYVCHVRLKIT